MQDREIPDYIKEGAGFAALSYAFFMCFFMLNYRKDNPFIHYHAKQALVIFILEVIFAILTSVSIVGFFAKLILLVLFIFSAVGVFSSLFGKYVNFPIVGDIAKKVII